MRKTIAFALLGLAMCVSTHPAGAVPAPDYGFGEPTEGVRLKLELVKETIQQGEPASLRVTIQNASDKTVLFGLSDPTYDNWLTVQSPSGVTRTVHREVKCFFSTVTMHLTAGLSYGFTYATSGFLTFEEVGAYRITLSRGFRLLDGKGNVTAVSNTVMLRVTPNPGRRAVEVPESAPGPPPLTLHAWPWPSKAPFALPAPIAVDDDMASPPAGMSFASPFDCLKYEVRLDPTVVAGSGDVTLWLTLTNRGSDTFIAASDAEPSIPYVEIVGPSPEAWAFRSGRVTYPRMPRSVVLRQGQSMVVEYPLSRVFEFREAGVYWISANYPLAVRDRCWTDLLQSNRAMLIVVPLAARSGESN
ncbi:MAG TPA: hypothetical protein VGM37_04675 [Armatimonadota bacterium]|jgi:hypothetical protein